MIWPYVWMNVNKFPRSLNIILWLAWFSLVKCRYLLTNVVYFDLVKSRSKKDFVVMLNYNRHILAVIFVFFRVVFFLPVAFSGSLITNTKQCTSLIDFTTSDGYHILQKTNVFNIPSA